MSEAIDFEVNRENAKELDQFYTHPLIAKRFVDKVNELYNFDDYDYIVEPSMGEGFIYQHFPKDKRIGLDIEKNHPECLEGDFFKWLPEKSGIENNPLMMQRAKLIFVGNPPFGKGSKLAVEFFEHAAQFADVICFIIPRTWMKYSVQRRLPNDFGLYWQAVLPDAAFVYKGDPYEVRCVAQCWSRHDPQPNFDIEGNEDWREMELPIE